MIRKFMPLERSEYWEASDADWLYSAIYDVDVITNKASGGPAAPFKEIKILSVSYSFIINFLLRSLLSY